MASGREAKAQEREGMQKLKCLCKWSKIGEDMPPPAPIVVPTQPPRARTLTVGNREIKVSKAETGERKEKGLGHHIAGGNHVIP